MRDDFDPNNWYYSMEEMDYADMERKVLEDLGYDLEDIDDLSLDELYGKYVPTSEDLKDIEEWLDDEEEDEDE